MGKNKEIIIECLVFFNLKSKAKSLRSYSRVMTGKRLGRLSGQLSADSN